MCQSKIPLRKVTGELNPDWCTHKDSPFLLALAGTIPEMVDLMNSPIEYEKYRQLVGQALIDEEERIIDEFCGMKVPTEGVKSPPQYPLNTHQFEENIFCYRGKSPGEPGLVISPMFNLYKE